MATKAATNGKVESKVIEVPQLQTKQLILNVTGTSPLIPHRWSEKAKNMMLAKQMKKASQGREAKDPEQEFIDSLYILPPTKAKETFEVTFLSGKTKKLKGTPGLTPLSFKNAAVNAAQDAGMYKTFARRAFHVNLGEELIAIEGVIVMREDIGRTSTGVAMPIFRGHIWPWNTELEIRYNSSIISEEQIANLFRLAGFGVGVGDWRPEKNGQYGMFDLV